MGKPSTDVVHQLDQFWQGQRPGRWQCSHGPRGASGRGAGMVVVPRTQAPTGLLRQTLLPIPEGPRVDVERGRQRARGRRRVLKEPYPTERRRPGFARQARRRCRRALRPHDASRRPLRPPHPRREDRVAIASSSPPSGQYAWCLRLMLQGPTHVSAAHAGSSAAYGSSGNQVVEHCGAEGCPRGAVTAAGNDSKRASRIWMLFEGAVLQGLHPQEGSGPHSPWPQGCSRQSGFASLGPPTRSTPSPYADLLVEDVHRRRSVHLYVEVIR
jgi:hypothetical protein